jgi:iron complex transport system substrate-binding protein
VHEAQHSERSRRSRGAVIPLSGLFPASPAVFALLLLSTAPGAPPPKRIVALAPSAAEILFALGAADRVVAVSDFAADLPEARGKAKTGGFTPDLERIVTLAPDLVVASRDGTDRASFEALQRLGLRVLATNGSSLDGVLEDVRAVGEAIGERERALRFVDDARRRMAVAEARARARRLAGSAAISVLVVIWPDPPVVAGPSTFIGDLLKRALLVNVVSPSAGEWPRVSYETLAAWNPDVLLRPTTAENADVFSRAFLPGSRWSLVPAVREGRLVTLPGNWIERPGPRLLDALERLVDLTVPARKP